MCCSVLQCVTVCCSVLQCVAVCCSVLQRVAACCSLMQFSEIEETHHLPLIARTNREERGRTTRDPSFAIHGVLQCVAVCCSNQKEERPNIRHSWRAAFSLLDRTVARPVCVCIIVYASLCQIALSLVLCVHACLYVCARPCTHTRTCECICKLFLFPVLVRTRACVRVCLQSVRM